MYSFVDGYMYMDTSLTHLHQVFMNTMKNKQLINPAMVGDSSSLYRLAGQRFWVTRGVTGL